MALPDAPPSLEHFTLPGDGVRLHAVAAGDPAAPPVILLHGFPEGWPCWRHQFGPFARAGFRPVALEQRGYGTSDKPPRVADYSLDRLCADVLTAADALGASRLLVVGHDWGAIVAWRLAMTRPDRVAKLAVLNVPHPTAMKRAIFGGDLGQLVRSWYAFAFQLPRLPEWVLGRNDFAGMERGMRRTSRPGSFADADFAEYRRGWSEPGALTGMVNWYRAAARARPPEPADPRVRVPTLIVWGAQDAFLRIRLARASARLCDDVRLEILPQATHWVQHDEPDRVNRLLIDFLAMKEVGRK